MGITGIGEPSPYGAPLANMLKILKDKLIPYWIGLDPLDQDKLKFKYHEIQSGYGNVGLSALNAGFSQALWDIYGKIENKPLYKLINPKSNGKIKTYASAGMWFDESPLEEVVIEAVKYFKQGFKFYKIRPETPINAGNHLQRNNNPPKVNIKRFIKLLEKINFATNGNLRLMVDAGCRLNFNEALYLSQAMNELNCFFLEEPVARDYTQYSKLKKESKMPIAGGESLVSRDQFNTWVKHRALDYLQPDANLAGVNEILKTDPHADKNNLKIILHNWANDVNSATNAHLGAALKTCQMVETNLTYNPLKKHLLKKRVNLKDGEFILSEKPGLGIEINESILNKYSFNIKL